MSRSLKLILLPLLLIAVTLACGGSRDVIGSVDSPSQSTQGESSGSPTQQTQSEPVPSATPRPAIVLAADVIDLEFYTSSDYLYFIGLVQNTGNIDLEFVEIHITLRDASGTLVKSASTYSDLDVIPTGGVSPFKVIFLDNPEGWQDFEVNVEGDEAGFYNPYLDFEVVSSQGTIPSFGAYQIVGEIRNTGDTDAEFVEIIAVLYDANNHIIGVDFTFSDFDKVTANGTSPFELFFFSKAPGDIASYELFIQGNRAD